MSSLPAVNEACSPGGIFRAIIDQPFLHPNKESARRAIDGSIDFDKVPFLQNARPLTVYEFEVLKFARAQIDTTEDFKMVLVTETMPTVTFGGYLLLDEDAILDPNLPYIIAHELAHKVNGDSYVKAAFWFLGKGWMQETVTPFGVEQEDPHISQMRSTQTVANVTRATLSGGWVGLALSLGMAAVSHVGSGARSLEPEINDFFRRWDIKADELAETWVNKSEYQGYLASETTEAPRRPFDASVRVRLEHSEVRGDPKYVPPTVKKVEQSTPAWKILMYIMAVLVAAPLFWFMVFLLSAIAG